MQIFEKKLKKPKNRPQGARGSGVKKKFYPNFYYFFLGAHAKIWNNTTTPSVVLVTAVPRKEKKVEKCMQNNGLRLSDTVCTAPLGPKF